MAGYVLKHPLDYKHDDLFMENLRRRIMLRVVVQDSGCWEWCGWRDWKNYGVMKMGGTPRKTFRVHRLMYLIANRELPDELCVCHHCDNPPCCNPEHLWLGTASENTLDRHAKGRTRCGAWGKKVSSSNV